MSATEESSQNRPEVRRFEKAARAAGPAPGVADRARHEPMPIPRRRIYRT
jgi:hypothetical protein